MVHRQSIQATAQPTNYDILHQVSDELVSVEGHEAEQEIPVIKSSQQSAHRQLVGIHQTPADHHQVSIKAVHQYPPIEAHHTMVNTTDITHMTSRQTSNEPQVVATEQEMIKTQDIKQHQITTAKTHDEVPWHSLSGFQQTQENTHEQLTETQQDSCEVRENTHYQVMTEAQQTTQQLQTQLHQTERKPKQVTKNEILLQATVEHQEVTKEESISTKHWQMLHEKSASVDTHLSLVTQENVKPTLHQPQVTQKITHQPVEMQQVSQEEREHQLAVDVQQTPITFDHTTFQISETAQQATGDEAIQQGLYVPVKTKEVVSHYVSTQEISTETQHIPAVVDIQQEINEATEITEVTNEGHSQKILDLVVAAEVTPTETGEIPQVKTQLLSHDPQHVLQLSGTRLDDTCNVQQTLNSSQIMHHIVVGGSINQPIKTQRISTDVDQTLNQTQEVTQHLPLHVKGHTIPQHEPQDQPQIDMPRESMALQCMAITTEEINTSKTELESMQEVVQVVTHQTSDKSCRGLTENFTQLVEAQKLNEAKEFSQAFTLADTTQILAETEFTTHQSLQPFIEEKIVVDSLPSQTPSDAQHILSGPQQTLSPEMLTSVSDRQQMTHHYPIKSFSISHVVVKHQQLPDEKTEPSQQTGQHQLVGIHQTPADHHQVSIKAVHQYPPIEAHHTMVNTTDITHITSWRTSNEPQVVVTEQEMIKTQDIKQHQMTTAETHDEVPCHSLSEFQQTQENTHELLNTHKPLTETQQVSCEVRENTQQFYQVMTEAQETKQQLQTQVQQTETKLQLVTEREIPLQATVEHQQVAKKESVSTKPQQMLHESSADLVDTHASVITQENVKPTLHQPQVTQKITYQPVEMQQVSQEERDHQLAVDAQQTPNTFDHTTFQITEEAHQAIGNKAIQQSLCIPVKTEEVVRHYISTQEISTETQHIPAVVDTQQEINTTTEIIEVLNESRSLKAQKIPDLVVAEIPPSETGEIPQVKTQHVSHDPQQALRLSGTRLDDTCNVQQTPNSSQIMHHIVVDASINQPIKVHRISTDVDQTLNQTQKVTQHLPLHVKGHIKSQHEPQIQPQIDTPRESMELECTAITTEEINTNKTEPESMQEVVQVVTHQTSDKSCRGLTENFTQLVEAQTLNEAKEFSQAFTMADTTQILAETEFTTNQSLQPFIEEKIVDLLPRETPSDAQHILSGPQQTLSPEMLTSVSDQQQMAHYYPIKTTDKPHVVKHKQLSDDKVEGVSHKQAQIQDVSIEVQEIMEQQADKIETKATKYGGQPYHHQVITTVEQGRANQLMVDMEQTMLPAETQLVQHEHQLIAHEDTTSEAHQTSSIIQDTLHEVKEDSTTENTKQSINNPSQILHHVAVGGRQPIEIHRISTDIDQTLNQTQEITQHLPLNVKGHTTPKHQPQAETPIEGIELQSTVITTEEISPCKTVVKSMQEVQVVTRQISDNSQPGLLATAEQQVETEKPNKATDTTQQSLTEMVFITHQSLEPITEEKIVYPVPKQTSSDPWHIPTGPQQTTYPLFTETLTSVSDQQHNIQQTMSNRPHCAEVKVLHASVELQKISDQEIPKTPQKLNESQSTIVHDEELMVNTVPPLAQDVVHHSPNEIHQSTESTTEVTLDPHCPQTMLEGIHSQSLDVQQNIPTDGHQVLTSETQEVSLLQAPDEAKEVADKELQVAKQVEDQPPVNANKSFTKLCKTFTKSQKVPPFSVELQQLSIQGDSISCQPLANTQPMLNKAPFEIQELGATNRTCLLSLEAQQSIIHEISIDYKHKKVETRKSFYQIQSSDKSHELKHLFSIEAKQDLSEQCESEEVSLKTQEITYQAPDEPQQSRQLQQPNLPHVPDDKEHLVETHRVITTAQTLMQTQHKILPDQAQIMQEVKEQSPETDNQISPLPVEYDEDMIVIDFTNSDQATKDNINEVTVAPSKSDHLFHHYQLCTSENLTTTGEEISSCTFRHCSYYILVTIEKISQRRAFNAASLKMPHHQCDLQNTRKAIEELLLKYL